MNAVTFTEREAIKKMMEYIEEEKKRLSNQYIGLLDRLRELDQIEKPLQEVTAPTNKIKVRPLNEEPQYVNIPMQIPTPFAPNYSNVPSCNLSNLNLPLADEVKPMSLEEMITKINEDNKQKEEELIPKTEIEALKDKDEKNKPVKTSSQRDVKVVTQFIKAILKEAGVPIRTSELINRLKEAGINTSSPYVLLQQASQYDPKIEKPKFGFYQYNFSA